MPTTQTQATRIARRLRLGLVDGALASARLSSGAKPGIYVW